MSGWVQKARFSAEKYERIERLEALERLYPDVHQRPRRKYKLRPPNPTETEEAFWLASWLTWQGLCFTHIPNGEKRPHKEKFGRHGEVIRYSPEGKKLKRMGVRKGVADYFILDTPPARPELKGVFVELKAKGKKPTPEQLVFIAEAVARGYGAFWIETGEAAAEILKEQYGYGRR